MASAAAPCAAAATGQPHIPQGPSAPPLRGRAAHACCASPPTPLPPPHPTPPHHLPILTQRPHCNAPARPPIGLVAQGQAWRRIPHENLRARHILQHAGII